MVQLLGAGQSSAASSNIVTLDFIVDERALESDRATDPPSRDAALLRHTLFQMPVRLLVDGVEVVNSRLPIFYVAAVGREVLEELLRAGSAYMMLPGESSLLFLMQGDDVLITYTGGRLEVLAPYEELSAAWRRFGANVRALLLREFPAFREHGQVGAWFREEG